MKEERGQEKYTDFVRKGKRAKIVKQFPALPKLFNVSLVSERLGLKTAADAIMINETEKEAYPIQAKYSFTPRKIYKTMKAQLIMEAILIEDWLKYDVPFGFIKFIRSGDLIKVSLLNREATLCAFKEIRDIINSERYPEATQHKQRCIDCCFRRYCWGQYESDSKN